MKTKSLLLASLLALSSIASAAQPETKAATPAAKTFQLSLEYQPWQGDFDQMLERRMIRVLVPYSRTLYYVDKGRERGLAADLLRDFLNAT